MSAASKELAVESGIKSLPAFDEHICAINLRANTNNPTDGYGVGISAYFGSERVNLKIGDEEISFKFEIYKAELTIDAVNCEIDATFTPKFDIEEPFPPESLDEVDSREVKTRWKVSSGSLIQNVANIDYERSTEGLAPKKIESWYQIHRLNDRTLQIASLGKNSKPLNGKIISEYVGWYVLPKLNSDSGILAKVRVREDWIKLVDPIPLDHDGPIWEQIYRFLRKGSNESRARREAFNILLTHLVEIGLQANSNSKEATLDVDAIVVRPADDLIYKIESSKVDSPPLSISVSEITYFLQSAPGSERAILEEIGVPKQRLLEYSEALAINTGPPETKRLSNRSAYQIYDDLSADQINIKTVKEWLIRVIQNQRYDGFLPLTEFGHHARLQFQNQRSIPRELGFAKYSDMIDAIAGVDIVEKNSVPGVVIDIEFFVREKVYEIIKMNDDNISLAYLGVKCSQIFPGKGKVHRRLGYKTLTDMISSFGLNISGAAPKYTVSI